MPLRRPQRPAPKKPVAKKKPVKKKSVKVKKYKRKKPVKKKKAGPDVRVPGHAHKQYIEGSEIETFRGPDRFTLRTGGKKRVIRKKKGKPSWAP